MGWEKPPLYVGVQAKATLGYPSIGTEGIFTLGIATDLDGERAWFFKACGGASFGGPKPVALAGNLVIGVLFDGSICTMEWPSVGADLDTDLDLGFGDLGVGQSVCLFVCLFFNSKVAVELSIEYPFSHDPSAVSFAVNARSTCLVNDYSLVCKKKLPSLDFGIENLSRIRNHSLFDLLVKNITTKERIALCVCQSNVM